MTRRVALMSEEMSSEWFDLIAFLLHGLRLLLFLTACLLYFWTLIN